MQSPLRSGRGLQAPAGVATEAVDDVSTSALQAPSRSAINDALRVSLALPAWDLADRSAASARSWTKGSRPRPWVLTKACNAVASDVPRLAAWARPRQREARTSSLSLTRSAAKAGAAAEAA